MFCKLFCSNYFNIKIRVNPVAPAELSYPMIIPDPEINLCLLVKDCR